VRSNNFVSPDFKLVEHYIRGIIGAICVTGSRRVLTMARLDRIPRQLPLFNLLTEELVVLALEFNVRLMNGEISIPGSSSKGLCI